MTLNTIVAEPPPAALPALAGMRHRHAELLARRAQHQPEEGTLSGSQSGSRDATASQGSRWSSSLRWASSPTTRHLGGVALGPFGHRSKLRTPYRVTFPAFHAFHALFPSDLVIHCRCRLHVSYLLLLTVEVKMLQSASGMFGNRSRD
jgi:hypothetical protein